MALEERLRLIVDATTGSADAEFGKLTTAAERTATAADTAAESVSSAADRVAQARAREADAAGKLAVAEAKLEEVRARYGEGSSQLVAAEERVASAQRNVQLAASNTTTALERQEIAQRDAADAADQGAVASDRAAVAGENAGRGTERFREEVGGLKGAVVGLVAGASLADWVSDSIRGFTEGARGAGQLATSMNATTEEGGRFLTVASQLGLEMNDLLEIQASFADVVGRDAEALSSFGAEVKTNRDGTTNWALTLQDALAELQKIPDATKRNQLGFQLFGEEGYKQMSQLLLSGRDVNEVFESMGTPFTDDDVTKAREFDDAMRELSATGGGVSRELGSVLVPVLTGVLEGISTITDAATSMPPELALAAGAAVLLGFANRASAAEGGFLAGALSSAQGAATRFSGAAVAAAGSSGTAALAMGGMRVAAGGMATMLGGPVGIALLAVGAGFSILNAVTGENEAQSQAAEQAQEGLANALRESGGVITENVRRQAALAAQEAGLLDIAKRAGVGRGEVTDALLKGGAAYDAVREKLLAYSEANKEVVASTGGSYTQLDEEGRAARDAAEGLEELRDKTAENTEGTAELAAELETTTDAASLATAATEALATALDAGTASTEELSRLAGEAADAQDAEARSADRAKAAIEAHNAVTRDAAAATRERIDAIYASENAEFAWLEALDAANAATDDGTTRVNEQREAQVKLMEAALRAADAAADAAIESREAAGDVLADLDRANIRATEVLENLRGRLNAPGLSQGARDEMQGLIDQLTIAQENGDIEAVLRLTGAEEAKAETDAATEDRDTTITVESRGGPAVSAYLGSIANAERLALIRVESRGGPAVLEYLRGLAVEDRLALIRVESRGGPDVERYIDGLARERFVILRLETRGGPAVQRYLDDLTGERNVRINASRGAGAPLGAPALAGVAGASRVMLGSVTLDLELTGRADRAQLSAAQRGRAHVADIKAFERESGTGWRNR